MMKTLINDGWKFLKMPSGSTIREAYASESWADVDLPHDWLIWQADDLYESADAWYSRNIFWDQELPDVCVIRFDGVYMDCEVWLNGEYVCSHAYGYTAFDADLSGHMNKGRNDIMVHIRHQSPNSRWYSGSGIFRDVTLITMPADHIPQDGIYITTTREKSGWKVSIKAETIGTDRIPFSAIIRDHEGKTVSETVTESRRGIVEAELTFPDGKCWSLKKPYLYQMCCQYGKQTEVFKIGLRSIAFDPNLGFFLNGESIKLKGVCLHHDLGSLGAAFHEKAARRQLNLMKSMGVNALRTSHNPPASGMLDLCDEMGILVIDEAFDMWERPKTEYDYARFFRDHEAEDVAAWIRRDRNHPSVIMWSIGNEIYDMHADRRGTEITMMLKEQVESHDPDHHAAVTFGCNYMPWEGGQRCADIVKVAGYNYGENLYEKHHSEHPDWVIYGSETASVLSSRGIYHFPIEKQVMSEADLQCSALGNSNTSWGASDLRKMITDDLKCSYSMGQFIWSGIDYIGEPTPYHTRSCYFGQADTACFPKDSFYLFKSLWSDQPVLHIGVSWDWNPGQMIDVPVMTNCAEAELFVNGKRIGRKKAEPTDAEKCLPVWKIPYEKGKLTAKGYDANGNMILQDERVTPGDTERFVLSSEDEFLLSDGHDIAFVTVQAADRKGNPVDNARDRVHVSVTGGACLMGTDNGDSTDPDGYKSPCRRLFGGKLLIIIGSIGKTEDARVTVQSGETEAMLMIPVREAAPKAGFSRVMRIQEKECTFLHAIRKIEIRPEQSTHLSADNPECAFTWNVLPENADLKRIEWQITNDAGIETPYALLHEENGRIIVRANGDGLFYLRAMAGEHEDHADIISQIELTAEGIGTPALNPYEYISAGLYDIHTGDIGTGNEKGIAFSREGESMAGFSRIDFGSAGSDKISLDIFALDGKPYEIEVFDGAPECGGKLIDILHYEKPSIWNVYQSETYRLPVRLTGEKTLCFRMHQKVHMKGFVFERQLRAFRQLDAGSADMIYGDSFRRDGSAIRDIGNNVTLSFADMDFGDAYEGFLEIKGSTPLAVNTITIRITGEDGKSTVAAADFTGNGQNTQVFPICVPGGICTVSFVFLPGSHFDFEQFRFQFSGNSDFKMLDI